jgi:hypothetical protein
VLPFVNLLVLIVETVLMDHTYMPNSSKDIFGFSDFAGKGYFTDPEKEETQINKDGQDDISVFEHAWERKSSGMI